MSTIEIPDEEDFNAYRQKVAGHLREEGVDGSAFTLEIVVDGLSYRPKIRLSSKPDARGRWYYSSVQLNGDDLTDDIARWQAQGVAWSVLHAREEA